MTLHATRDVGHHDGTVTIHITYGPVTVRVTEPEGHVLQFWHDLGKLVAQEDNERRAKEGYERWHASFSDTLRPRFWQDLRPEDQAHWIAAFTE